MHCTGFRLCDKPAVMECVGCRRRDGSRHHLCAWHRRYTYCGNSLFAHRAEGEERRRIKDEHRGEAIVLARPEKRQPPIDVNAHMKAKSVLEAGGSLEEAVAASGMGSWQVQRLLAVIVRAGEKQQAPCARCGDLCGWTRSTGKAPGGGRVVRYRCASCNEVAS